MYYLKQFCRLCLTLNGDLNNMCNDNIIERASACIGDLEFDYNIPSLICNDCLEMLDLFFNFRNRCLQSEFILNHYITKLCQTKSINEFQSTDLRVNVINNTKISTIKFYKTDTKVKVRNELSSHNKGNTKSVKIEIEKKQISDNPQNIQVLNLQAIKNVENCDNLDDMDDVFLEDEDDDCGLNYPTKSVLKRPLHLEQPPNKRLKSDTIVETCNLKSETFTDITERVKLQKRKVQLKSRVAAIDTSTSKYEPVKVHKNSKELKSESIYNGDVATPRKMSTDMYLDTAIDTSTSKYEPVKVHKNSKELKSESIYNGDVATPRKMSTDMYLDKDITSHTIDIYKVKNSETPKPQKLSFKSKVQLHKLESVKPTCVTQKNDLYKANFSNILQLCKLNSPNPARPFKILLDNVDHTKPQVKLQYMSKSKAINTTYIEKSRSLLKSNQEQAKNSLKTINSEHNYHTEINTCSGGKIFQNDCKTDTTESLTTSQHSKEIISKTWEKFITLQKMNNGKHSVNFGVTNG